MIPQSAKSFASMSVLTELTIKYPGMEGKDTSATTAANKHLKADQNAGYYKKCKLARADIIDVINAGDMARNYRRKMTSPWGDGDLRMLPTSRLLEYNTSIGAFKTKFENAVFDVEKNWNDIVDRQKARLNKIGGKLFNPNDYPAQSQIGKWFIFKTAQLPIPQVEHFALQIQGQVVEDLKADLEKSTTEKLVKCQKNLFTRLIEPVSRMATICGDDKRVYESMITNMEDTIEILADLNVTGDMAFMQMIREIKDTLTGYTAGQIRKNKNLKHKLGQKAEEMVGKMQTMLGDLEDGH